MDSLYLEVRYSRAVTQLQCQDQDRVEFTVTNKESNILSFPQAKNLNAQTRTEERKITGNFGMPCVSNHQPNRKKAHTTHSTCVAQISRTNQSIESQINRAQFYDSLDYNNQVGRVTKPNGRQRRLAQLDSNINLLQR